MAVVAIRIFMIAAFFSALFLYLSLTCRNAEANDSTNFICFPDGIEYTPANPSGIVNDWCASVPNYDANWWEQDRGNCAMVSAAEIGGFWDAHGWEMFVRGNWPYYNSGIYHDLDDNFIQDGKIVRRHGINILYETLKAWLPFISPDQGTPFSDSHAGRMYRAFVDLDPDAELNWASDVNRRVRTHMITDSIDIRVPQVFSWDKLKYRFRWHNARGNVSGSARGDLGHNVATIGYRSIVRGFWHSNDLYIFARSGWESGGNSYLGIRWATFDDYDLANITPNVISGVRAHTTKVDSFDSDHDTFFDYLLGTNWPGVTKGDDCDDAIKDIHPNQREELCNDTDDNCTNGTDESSYADNYDTDCLYNDVDNCPYLPDNSITEFDYDVDCVPDKYDFCPGDPALDTFNPIPYNLTELHPTWKFIPITIAEGFNFNNHIDSDQDCIPDIVDTLIDVFNPPGEISCTYPDGSDTYWAEDHDGNGIRDCDQRDWDQDSILDIYDFCRYKALTAVQDQDGDCIPDHDTGGRPVADDECPDLFLPQDPNFFALDDDKDCVIDDTKTYRLKLSVVDMNLPNGNLLNGHFGTLWRDVPQDNCQPGNSPLNTTPPPCPWMNPNNRHEDLCCGTGTNRQLYCANTEQDNLDLLTEQQNKFHTFGDACDQRPALSFNNSVDGMSYMLSGFQISPRASLCNENRTYGMTSKVWRLDFQTMSPGYYSGRTRSGRIFPTLSQQPDRLGSAERIVKMQMCFCDTSQGGSGCENCGANSSFYDNPYKISYTPPLYGNNVPLPSDIFQSDIGQNISFDNNIYDQHLGGRNTKMGYSYSWAPETGTHPPLPTGTDFLSTSVRLRFIHDEPDKNTYPDSLLHNLAVATEAHTLWREDYYGDPCIPNLTWDQFLMPPQAEDNRAQEYMPGWWKIIGRTVDSSDEEWRQYIFDAGELMGFALPLEANLPFEWRNSDMASAAGPIATSSETVNNLGFEAPMNLDTEIALLQAYYQGPNTANNVNPGGIYISLTTNSETKWYEYPPSLQINPPEPRSRAKLRYLPSTRELLLIGDYISDNIISTDIHIFKILTKSWVMIADLPDHRTDYEAVLRNPQRELWLFGGLNENKEYATDVIVINLITGNLATFVIDQGDASQRINHTVIHDSQSDRFFIFGGSSLRGPETDGVLSLIPPSKEEIWSQSAQQKLNAWQSVVSGGSSAPFSVKTPLLYDPYSRGFVILVAVDEEDGYFETALESGITGFIKL